MYSLRKRILIGFTLFCFATILLVFGISYYNFRIFIYEIIQSFPSEMAIYLEADGVERFLVLNTEQAIFSLFIEKFQFLFLVLIFCSILLVGFSLPFVSIFVKNMMKNINQALISEQEIVPQEFLGIQEQLLIYAAEITKLNNQNKTFTSYASHELRNELAKLRSLYYKYEVAAEDILDQQSNIEKNIEDLLVLSSLNKQVEISQINLLFEIATVLDNEFSELVVEMEYDENNEYEVMGKRNWIFRVIYNLLDNVERYSCNNKVKINLKSWNNYIVLEIINYIEDKTIDEFPTNVSNHGIGLDLVKNVMDYLEGAYYYEITDGQVLTILSFRNNI